MNLKKNAVSYVTWMIILLFTGAAFSFLGMVAAHMLNVNIILAAAGCIIIFFGILFLVYYLTGFVVRMRKENKESPFLTKTAPMIEGAVVLVGLAAGLVVRVCCLSMAGEEAAYYEVSKVTNQGGILVQSVQGSVYYYCLLLHGLFRLVGNHWIAGIWLQMFLQIIGAGIVYLAVRKLTDRWPALVLLGMLLFAPSSVKAGLTYSPQMLYFCIFALVLLLVADYLKRSGQEESHPVAMWCYTGVVGLLIGICSYVDVTGCLLFLVVLCLPMVRREPGKNILWTVRLVLLIVLALLTFFMMFFVDGILSETSFLRVLHAWMVTYGGIGIKVQQMAENIQVDLFVIMILTCFGVFSFWRRKKEERFTPFVWLCVGISVLYFLGITTENMSGSYLLYVLFAALAAVCVTELFYGESGENMLKKEEDKIEIIDLEKTEESQGAEGAAVKPRFIENPLPGPKKHVRKVMDYAITPKEKEMRYDIQVSDTDDYDV